MRKYYEAYDDRYRQVHEKNLQWASNTPSPIVFQVLKTHGILPGQPILEIGCGEGRDAVHLLRQGYRILATDISPEAIRFCRKEYPEFQESFQVLDCIGGTMERKFDFIYAVAVVHMLVEDDDRAGFYRFLRDHLTPDGIGLVCSMGDGTIRRQSDIRTAFELQDRVHDASGKQMRIAGTSCRMVDFDTFREEIEENGLEIQEQGLTAVEPDFPCMMYAVVKRE